MQSIWHGVGRQLGDPRGWQGWAIGRLMRLANRAPNRLALDALSLSRDDAVLELGFGPGEALARMARRGCRTIHGVDRSLAMLRQATRRNRAEIASGRIQLRQGDFAMLPYGDAAFDKVLAVNVAYFWQDAAPVAEIRRVLRPGGRLVLYATDRRSMENWRFAGPTTHRPFDATELVELLVEGGFDRDRIALCSPQLAGGVSGLLIVAETERVAGG